jgi:hypothetical protein
MDRGTYIGPERRLQQDLREAIDQHLANGWELIRRQPLEMRRGRALVSQLPSGVLANTMETST